MLYRHAPNIGRRFYYPYPPAPPAPPARAASIASAASALKSGNWMEQARQVMAAAEQMRPLIEQYGPLMKNLPSMWKLYRAVNSTPDRDERSPEPSEFSIPVKKEPLKTSESTPWFPGRIS
ncbi:MULTISPECIES: VrrA/YqfQ family protein [Bacillaceae]|uniref:YqfQ-like protein n=1 Tax=Domibacillus aminovorans TaxID=29332 RepID=A0A177KSV9_9BACI|nr:MULTISPECIES: VrrA/YqfQ family protein [Bacillaceae]OAH56035.1 hypothetical protein AWH48_05020 [Domibacillus aminovorans]